MIYRTLQPGEPFEIGDEYLFDGKWKTMTEEEYRQWWTFRDHYDPEEGMSPFRRPAGKPEELRTKTMRINPYFSR